MEEQIAVDKDQRIEVSLNVPGRIPLDIRLALKGSARALEELFIALARSSSQGEIGVAGGSCCWTFSRRGGTVHLLIDGD